MSINKITKDRGETHGEFKNRAELRQALSSVLAENLDTHLPPEIQEALDMILVKISHVACGDPWFVDHWIGIQGYAQLVVDEKHRADAEKAKRAERVRIGFGIPSGVDGKAR